MDDFIGFVITIFLTWWLTFMLMADRVDLRQDIVVKSVTKVTVGYKVCFNDGNLMRNSCIYVSEQTFVVGDTIKVLTLKEYNYIIKK